MTTEFGGSDSTINLFYLSYLLVSRMVTLVSRLQIVCFAAKHPVIWFTCTNCVAHVDSSVLCGRL